MSFQAYIDNVEAKTGQSADALKNIAIGKGLAGTEADLVGCVRIFGLFIRPAGHGLPHG